jgi:hypothetical protein
VSDRYLITVRSGDGEIRVFELRGQKAVIGRDGESDLVLAGNEISRFHAELRRTPAGFTLTDLGSMNGTLLDGAPVPEHRPVPVAEGATLTIGPYELTIGGTGTGAALISIGAEPAWPPGAPEDEPTEAMVRPDLASAPGTGAAPRRPKGVTRPLPLRAAIGADVYPSLDALREAHTALLERRRAEGETPAVLGAAVEFLRRGAASGALLDDDAARRAAQSLLDFWSNALYRAGHEHDDATLADFDPLLAPELPDDLCPYVGLDTFRESDTHRFFGRAQLVAEMVRRLLDARLLAVVGPSGSGKSSLVQAGLLPALMSGALPGSAAWDVRGPFVPGSNPLAALDRALGEEAAPLQGTAAAPRRWAGGGPAPLLLIVDQFEETFTLCEDEGERRAFIERIVALATDPPHSAAVILTMRGDFETYVTRFPELQALFEAGRIQVTPMSAGELREAIERPAAEVGLRFEPGLVDALLHDILGEPAALPLLEFTLLELWKRRERNRVTMAAYREVGGGRLALARAADALYEGLIPEEQVTARRILMRLVRPGDGLEITSARVRRADLRRIGEDPERVERVLTRLLDARLLRTSRGDAAGDVQVEVTHEALIRNWPTLVQWLEEEREALRRRRRLTTAANQWQALGRDVGALLRGAALEEAERYADLSDRERAFVQASRAEVERAAHEREEQQRRELEQARALAEEQRLRADHQAAVGRRLRQIAGIAVAQTIIYIPLFIGIATQNTPLWTICFWLLVASGVAILALVLRRALER